jgi:hypothetical protein
MSDIKEPELTGAADWEPLEPFPGTVTAGRFVSGDGLGERFRVAWFRRPGDAGLVGRAWFGPGTEGPPRHAHGGSIAALLDEAMSAACWSRGHPVVSGRLEVDFRAPLPLGIVATFSSRVTTMKGRKLYTAARLDVDDAGGIAQATGLFIELTEAQLAAFTP